MKSAEHMQKQRNSCKRMRNEATWKRNLRKEGTHCRTVIHKCKWEDGSWRTKWDLVVASSADASVKRKSRMNRGRRYSSRYSNLGDNTRQWDFIGQKVTRASPKQVINKERSRWEWTQDFYPGTLDVHDFTVHNTLDKMSPEGIVQPDMQGRHNVCPRSVARKYLLPRPNMMTSYGCARKMWYHAVSSVFWESASCCKCSWHKKLKCGYIDCRLVYRVLIASCHIWVILICTSIKITISGMWKTVLATCDTLSSMRCWKRTQLCTTVR